MLAMEYIFISAAPYEMVSKETGEVLKGTTVYLLPLQSERTDKLNGSKPQKFNEAFETFKTVYSKLEYLKKYQFNFIPKPSAMGVKLQLNGLAQ